MKVGIVVGSSAKESLSKLANENHALSSDSSSKEKYDQLIANCNSIEDLKNIINQLVVDDLQREITFCDIIKDCSFVTEELFDNKMEPTDLLKESLDLESNVENDSPLSNPRMERLREMKDRAVYEHMIRNTDCLGRSRNGANSHYGDFRHELSQLSKIFWSFIGLTVTLAGSFVFGYYGSVVAFKSESYRVMVALTIMTVVFMAEIYFIAKTERF